MAYEMRISDWSSDVCSSDLQVTNFVAGNYRACNWNNLKVVGHADRSGSNAYNNTLSQARASNVADMLRPVVPGANVTVELRGEEAPRLPPEACVPEFQYRSFDIPARIAGVRTMQKSVTFLAAERFIASTCTFAMTKTAGPRVQKKGISERT